MKQNRCDQYHKTPTRCKNRGPDNRKTEKTKQDRHARLKNRRALKQFSYKQKHMQETSKDEKAKKTLSRTAKNVSGIQLETKAGETTRNRARIKY